MSECMHMHSGGPGQAGLLPWWSGVSGQGGCPVRPQDLHVPGQGQGLGLVGSSLSSTAHYPLVLLLPSLGLCQEQALLASVSRTRGLSLALTTVRSGCVLLFDGC